MRCDQLFLLAAKSALTNSHSVSSSCCGLDQGHFRETLRPATAFTIILQACGWGRIPLSSNLRDGQPRAHGQRSGRSVASDKFVARAPSDNTLKNLCREPDCLERLGSS